MLKIRQGVGEEEEGWQGKAPAAARGGKSMGFGATGEGGRTTSLAREAVSEATGSIPPFNNARSRLFSSSPDPSFLPLERFSLRGSSARQLHSPCQSPPDSPHPSPTPLLDRYLSCAIMQNSGIHTHLPVLLATALPSRPLCFQKSCTSPRIPPHRVQSQKQARSRARWQF